MKCLFYDNKVEMREQDSFNIEEILECGQCFRFNKTGDGKYRILAYGKILNIEQYGDSVLFYPCTEQEFMTVWYNYFDLGTNYTEIKQIIAKNDPIMQKAVDYAGGIRLLNQEPFETLVSFIISQNNNIPRIKGIISRLSANYGTAADENDELFKGSFPTLEQLLPLCIDDYMAIGTGFRAKYLCDCMQKLNSSEVKLDDIISMPTEQAKNTLLKIKGVGPKVADCVLLFSLGKREVYPVDVWVKRVTELLYLDNKETNIKEISRFAAQKWGQYAGYAQQYLFYYARSEKLGL